ncbi:MAG: hypothetical protein M3540_12445, partial [Actinomycetota bacterium]|nr:hypothetical protein [Actinomycetota bacterium]
MVCGMSTDSAAAPSESSSRLTDRRRLLVFLGAGGGAALASLFTRGEARAGHDGTNVLHLGEGNIAPGRTVIFGSTPGDEGGMLSIRNSPSGRAFSTT